MPNFRLTRLWPAARTAAGRNRGAAELHDLRRNSHMAGDIGLPVLEDDARRSSPLMRMPW